MVKFQSFIAVFFLMLFFIFVGLSMPTIGQTIYPTALPFSTLYPTATDYPIQATYTEQPDYPDQETYTPQPPLPTSTIYPPRYETIVYTVTPSPTNTPCLITSSQSGKFRSVRWAGSTSSGIPNGSPVPNINSSFTGVDLYNLPYRNTNSPTSDSYIAASGFGGAIHNLASLNETWIVVPITSVKLQIIPVGTNILGFYVGKTRESAIRIGWNTTSPIATTTLDLSTYSTICGHYIVYLRGYQVDGYNVGGLFFQWDIGSGFVNIPTTNMHGVDPLTNQASQLPATPTPTNTATKTNTPTTTSTATETMVPTETFTPIPTETMTPIPTETFTLVPTETFTPLPTETETLIPTETATLIPTETLTLVPTETQTLTPTLTLVPTETATVMATETETPTPTIELVPITTTVSLDASKYLPRILFVMPFKK